MAIVLAESPAEGFAHQRRWDLFVIRICLVVIFDKLFQVEWRELVIRLGLISCQLLELLLIVFLLLLPFIVSFCWCIRVGSSGVRIRIITTRIIRLCSRALRLIRPLLAGQIILKLLQSGLLGSISLLFLLSLCLLFLCGFSSSYFGEALFLSFLVQVNALFLFVPVLNIVEYLLLVNMGNAIVLGQLLREE